MRNLAVMVMLLLASLPVFAAESAADARVRLAQASFQTPSKPLQSTDFELSGLDGKKLKLSSLKGSIVLLNFWATWCPPCRAEIPSMESFHKKLKDKGLRVLAVDLAEEKATVKDFVSKNKMDVTVLLDTTGQVGTTYGASNIPTTYVIGRDGSILARTVGSREWDTPEMVALFESLLKAK